MLCDPDAPAIQLALIDELTTFLRKAGIAHWLFGGWAVDFLVGTITRSHDDIDLIIWLRDAPAFRKALRAHGFVEAPPPPEEHELHTHYSKQGQKMDVMFIYQKEDGIYWSDWCWPGGSFTPLEGRLDKVVCPVVGGKTLLGAKEGYWREGVDPEDEEKCLLDIASLRSLFGEGV